MQPQHAVLVLVLVLAACGTDVPSTPEPVDNEPGPEPRSSLTASTDSIVLQATRGGSVPAPAEVRITSSAGNPVDSLSATVTHGPGQPTGWLTASFDQATTPAVLSLHVTMDTLPAGAWWADITVSAPGVGEPRVIRVHLTVEPADVSQINLQLGGYTLFDYDPGSGTITGAGAACRVPADGVCVRSLPIGTTFTLTATPDPDSFILYWQLRPFTPGDIPLPCEYETVTCDQVAVAGGWDVYAFFMLKGWHFGLTVEGANANGWVEVRSYYFGGPPDNCQLVNGVQQGQCGGYQSYGTRDIIMLPHPAPGSVFTGWSGDCVVTGEECRLLPIPDGFRAATATFATQ
jgi:hypothetical protein